MYAPAVASFPSSQNANMYRVESLVSFLRKHDVIKIGPKQKGNVLHVVQPTTLQRSVCMIFNARQLDTCNKLPATFVPFPVLSRGYAHAQLSSFYLLSTFTASHMRKKYQALHACITSMFAFRSVGAWEQGYFWSMVAVYANRLDIDLPKREALDISNLSRPLNLQLKSAVRCGCGQ